MGGTVAHATAPPERLDWTILLGQPYHPGSRTTRECREVARRTIVTATQRGFESVFRWAAARDLPVPPGTALSWSLWGAADEGEGQRCAADWEPREDYAWFGEFCASRRVLRRAHDRRQPGERWAGAGPYLQCRDPVFNASWRCTATLIREACTVTPGQAEREATGIYEWPPLVRVGVWAGIGLTLLLVSASVLRRVVSPRTWAADWTDERAARGRSVWQRRVRRG